MGGINSAYGDAFEPTPEACLAKGMVWAAVLEENGFGLIVGEMRDTSELKRTGTRGDSDRDKTMASQRGKCREAAQTTEKVSVGYKGREGWGGRRRAELRSGADS